MILGILVHAVRRLMPARARVIAHTRCGDGVGVHAVLADDEYSRMNRLGTQNPWALTTNHRNDTVGDGEIHRARAENVDENARESPPFIATPLSIEFGGCARRSLYLPIVEDGFAIAVNAQRRNTEQVLDAKSEPHFFMVLHLAHAHEEVAVFIRMVQLKGGEDIWFALDLQQ